MSILIKGMRMPENCIKCPMQFGGMCYVMPAEVDESRVAPTVEDAWKQGKPDWCPLVEIPEPQEGHWIEGKIYRDVIECNCSECGQLMTTAATVRTNNKHDSTNTRTHRTRNALRSHRQGGKECPAGIR